MRTRAFVHVGGPKHSGKTTFVEAVLGEIDALTLVARCVRDDTLKRPRETAPKTNSELRRYRQAGASGVALFNFAGDGYPHDDFFTTDLMSDYSEAVVIEGDNPLAHVDLSVFVAPAPVEDEQLFVRTARPRGSHNRAAVLEQILGGTETVADLLGTLGGSALEEMGRRNPELLEKVRRQLLDEVRATGGLSPSKPKMRWAISDPYAGIDHAQMVVVNIRRDNGDHLQAERLADDVRRLRQDNELLTEVLGPSASRVPITVVVADLAKPSDPGLKKAFARTRRAIRSASS